MPGQAPAVTDERELLFGYLVQQQDGFRNAMHGLTDEEAGRAAVPTTTLTVGTLVKHVAQTQQYWLDLARAAAGEEVPAADPASVGAAWQAAWTWTDEDTVASVTTAFDAVCAAVLAGVRRLDPDTAVPVPPAPWNPRDVEAWSARWVWLHLVEELARHAGHADIVREAIDGATMYELMAGREGWPETDWLKPWRRPA
jgi:hypothetical protein